MRISDWSSDVCSSDLFEPVAPACCPDCGCGSTEKRRTDVDQKRLPATKPSETPGATPRCRFPRTSGHARAESARAPSRSSARPRGAPRRDRSEEHTSELQSLMRISYAVFCLKNKKKNIPPTDYYNP